MFGLHLAVLFPNAPYAQFGRVLAQGGVGVSFFFVLSGFVLTWSAPPRDRSRSFYRRRVARVFPNHVATWAATAVLYGALGLPVLVGPVLGTLGLVQAWVPSPGYYNALDAPSWSLSAEAFFYLLFPVALRVVRALPRGPRLLILVMAVEVVLALGVASGPAAYGTAGYWAMYYLPLSRLAEFVVGIVLAVELAEGRAVRIGLYPALVLAAGAYAAAGWAPAGFREVAVTIVPFSLLVGAAAARDRSGRRPALLSRAVPVALGKWSYAFYLVHWPVMVAMAHAEIGHRLTGWAAAANAAGAFALSLFGAWLIYRVVEVPGQRLIRGQARAGGAQVRRPGAALTNGTVAPAAEPRRAGR